MAVHPVSSWLKGIILKSGADVGKLGPNLGNEVGEQSTPVPHYTIFRSQGKDTVLPAQAVVEPA